MPTPAKRMAPVPTLAKLMKNNELGEVRVQPLPTVARRKPIPARSVVTDARAAVLAFLAETSAVTDYEFIAFKDWHQSYHEVQAEKGWPPLTEKSLSQAMQVVGCDRRMIDQRKRGGGRVIAFRVPAEMGLAA